MLWGAFQISQVRISRQDDLAGPSLQKCCPRSCKGAGLGSRWYERGEPPSSGVGADWDDLPPRIKGVFGGKSIAIPGWAGSACGRRGLSIPKTGSPRLGQTWCCSFSSHLGPSLAIQPVDQIDRIPLAHAKQKAIRQFPTGPMCYRS